MALVLCALLLSGASALGGEAAPTSFSHTLAQGRFLLDGGLARQALAELQAAAQMELGRGDPEVHHLLARAAWQAGDVGIAVEAIRRARALAGSGAVPDLVEFYDFLTTRFGKVLVIGGGSSDARVPEPAVPLLDPEIKRVFEGAVQAIAAPGAGSTSVYLPVGAYRVGAHLVEVRAGGTASMDLRPSVGMTASGVFGEGGRVRSAAGVEHRFSIGLLGAGYAQQGAVAAQLRGLIGYEPVFGDRLGLRFVAAVGPLGLEQFQGDVQAPPGVLVEGRVGLGLWLPAAGGAALGPWLAYQVGVGRPIDAALPAGYQGPESYLVHGPDLSLRILLPAQGPARGAIEFGAMLREFQPLSTTRPSDDRPHLGVGGQAGISVLLGGSR